LGSSRTNGTTVCPAYSKYASSTTTTASGSARASDAITSGSTSSPVGLAGLQTQTTSALRSASGSSDASTTSAPSMPLAIAYNG